MSFKDYALSHQTEICLELERVKLLLQKAGNPDRNLKIIHVAGTNGKGSVCSFVCSGLMHMKKKFGKFSSPELICINDTISVNGIDITNHELDSLLAFLSPLCDEVKAETGKAPSQFEICFVAALLHFVSKKCEYAVLECGMGGMGDATNAIEDSYLSVITHIALDHTQFLGDTLPEIATNKCGILKASSTVITAPQEACVMEIINAKSKDKKLIVADRAVSTGHSDFCEIFTYKDMKNLKSSLCGVHQIYNASIAIEILKFIGATEENIRYALSTAANPARLERIGNNVFFDGAHNPDGVKALVDSINRYNPDGNFIFVIGFMKDKNYKEALSLLKNLRNQNFEIYTVNVHSNPRSETSQNLCETAKSLGFTSHSSDNIRDAICAAKKNADFVFAFGSLYMYKELHQTQGD